MVILMTSQDEIIVTNNNSMLEQRKKPLQYLVILYVPLYHWYVRYVYIILTLVYTLYLDKYQI